MIQHDFDHHLLRANAFALVAPTVLDDLPSGVTATPLVPRGLEASAHLMPGLIDLRALKQDVADALLEQLHAAHINGVAPLVDLLVDTKLDAEAFARHWNNVQLVSPVPGQSAWLRLHDPRVLHQLLRMLEQDQRAALFGRVQTMTYWLCGVWVATDANAAVATDPASPFAPPARWDWKRIERIGIINRALHEAGTQGEAMHSNGHAVEQLIAYAAQRYHLTSTADLVEFAKRGLTISTLFDTHPQIAPAMMPNDDDDDSTLADRLALIDEDVWQAIRHDAYEHRTIEMQQCDRIDQR